MATRSKISNYSELERIVRAIPRQLTVDEGVQDGHGSVGDTGVGVDLLED